jgi:glycerophosphoryl diester phosphodiesterase
VELIGHRGGAALGPENTIAAIEAGVAAGADGVEVDVRISADGAVVLMHDPDVARTTSGGGRVADLTLEALRALRVPTLDEALAAVPTDRLLIVELKGHPWEAGYDPSEPAAHAVAAKLATAHVRRIVVSSFNPVALHVVREDAPSVPTAVLTTAAFDLASNLAGAIDGGHAECHVPAQILEESFVAEAHRSGRRVVAWTVDDPERLQTFAAWGVDGVITDDPGAARRALGPG